VSVGAAYWCSNCVVNFPPPEWLLTIQHRCQQWGQEFEDLACLSQGRQAIIPTSKMLIRAMIDKPLR